MRRSLAGLGAAFVAIVGCNAILGIDPPNPVRSNGSDGGPAADGSASTEGGSSDGGPCPSDDFALLANTSGSVTSMVADDSHVYYTESSPLVRRVAIGDGSTTVFATSDAGTITMIVQNGNNTVWASADGVVHWQAKQAADPSYDYTALIASPSKLALDDDNSLFWAAPGSISSVAFGAVGSSISVRPIEAPDFLALTPAEVYFFGKKEDAGGPGLELFGCNDTTCPGRVPGEPVATAQSPKAAATSRGGVTRLVWLNSDGTLRSVQSGSANAEDLGRFDGALAVAADADFAYVLASTSLTKVSLSDQKRTVLTCFSSAPSALLAASPNELFWPMPSPRRIVRRAK